jgi:nucleoside-diphosphate-sugar epimerase
MLLALTGATGFIGQHLLRDLPKRGYRVRALLRRPVSLPTQTASAVIGDLARPQNMSAALEGVDAVIHSAGLSHGMTGVPEDDYRVLNTEATIGFARAARRAGAKRFIFLSSIRAQCGPTAETVLNETLEPKPTDAYGRSKLAAERGLAELDLDWVSLRAALVYGPGVKGNMAPTAAAFCVHVGSTAGGFVPLVVTFFAIERHMGFAQRMKAAKIWRELAVASSR